jgi:hypothetical protein
MNGKVLVTQAQVNDTEAFHAAGGNSHVVALKALHVLLTPDEDGWFAQGLEVDYAATGDSVDAVKSNFSSGLALTVHEHLKLFGNIKKFLKVAPQEAWEEYYSAPNEAIRQAFTTIQLHDVSGNEVAFPFDDILYVKTSGSSKAHDGSEAAAACA